ncbi:hypothetical protein MLD38_016898 [Melastoma candidum]|uniref:Uncharacterized protein n=1 Tax=Melastoma candidum TaxID=119954 RepID=A0ACB9QSD5_9MYRT|nr:hypothetical protein MLD38_016898 [Melastoma candidum]
MFRDELLWLLLISVLRMINKLFSLRTMDWNCFWLLISSNPKQQLGWCYALSNLANKVTSLSPAMQLLPLQHHRETVLCPRICLLASSDAFNAMFDGGYREKDAREIEIPNIRWDVFELMMRSSWSADQYLLEGLKRLCEYAMQDVSLDNVSSMYELSEAFNAMSLRNSCILFILEHFDRSKAGKITV